MEIRINKSKRVLSTYGDIETVITELRSYNKNGLFDFCEYNKITYTCAWSPDFLISIINDALLSRL